MMIYLDNSATSFPKPQTVSAACSGALRAYANPGRGGHSLSIGASEEIYSARKAVSEFFNAEGAEDKGHTEKRRSCRCIRAGA